MKKYIAITAFSDILFGLIPIYWKLFSSNVSTLYILLWRIVWSIPFTLVIILLERNTDQLKLAFHQKKVLGLTALAGMVITGNWYVYIWAVTNAMVLETSMAYFMSPLIVFVLGVVVFKEKAAKTDVIAVVIAAVGVLVSSLMLGVFPWVSIVLAVTFAVYGALKKAAGLNPAVSLTVEMTCILPIAIVGLLFTSFGANSMLTGITVKDIVLLVFTGFISSFPLWLYSYGVKELPFSLVGFLQFIWPSTSLLLSIFGFHEKLVPAKLVCFCFVWVALIIFAVGNTKKGKNAPQKAAH